MDIAHIFEPAASGRSRCRGCGQRITHREVRFGERLENPYADGSMTIWYHPLCAAWRRPKPVLEALAASASTVEDATRLRRIAEFSLSHRRVSRIAGAERASSGRARCRQCRELISASTWRIPLLFYEEGSFTASGFVHLTCAERYFGSAQLLDCVLHFGSALTASDLEEITAVLR